MISKLLIKDKNKRMKIEEVLDHPWIVGQDKSIKELRRKSSDMGDKVLQFVAYSNTNLDKIQENSPRSAQNPQFFSLANAANVKPGSF